MLQKPELSAGHLACKQTLPTYLMGMDGGCLIGVGCLNRGKKQQMNTHRDFDNWPPYRGWLLNRGFDCITFLVEYPLRVKDRRRSCLAVTLICAHLLLLSLKSFNSSQLSFSFVLWAECSFSIFRFLTCC